MTDHVTLLWCLYIHFWQCLGMFSWCSGWMQATRQGRFTIHI